jgi:hypothetical protein
LFEDLASALEGQGMLSLTQEHGPGDAPTAAIHIHLLATLRASRGAVAEERGVHLLLGLSGALREALLESTHRVITLEQGEQKRGIPDEAGRHDPSSGGGNRTRNFAHDDRLAELGGTYRVETQFPAHEPSRTADTTREQDTDQKQVCEPPAHGSTSGHVRLQGDKDFFASTASTHHTQRRRAHPGRYS